MSKTHRQSDRETQIRTKGSRLAKRTKETREIDWAEWWPFERATGAALRQLTKRQPPVRLDFEDAPF